MIRVTQFFKATSNTAQGMHYDLDHAHGTIYSRYGRPSQQKIRAWENIIQEYCSNGGLCEVMLRGQLHHWEYNHDCAIVGASSHFFSTCATFTDLDTNIKYIVKETHANTYACQL